MSNIAIFASGSGTNAENIISYFQQHDDINVISILCNKPNAYVIERAINHDIEYLTFDKNDLYNSSKILDYLEKNKIDFIVLAGFLLLMPEDIVNVYSGRIINIHPALLPAYGGKGMYGDNVHKAVIEAKEKFSGITIHYVNPNFDEGDVIFQAQVEINQNDTPDSLSKKIHILEQAHFPNIIKQVIKSLK